MFKSGMFKGQWVLKEALGRAVLPDPLNTRATPFWIHPAMIQIDKWAFLNPPAALAAYPA
ncbi:hypothetical protein [Hydrogenophaga sp.]|uniref:hypothetical protein n=1 Tax=Hydrogenophaga sp. TaxID=1904254 RepID=UPI002731E006|nr:hypothetical protein [Hydrogenophaga sp.]MDP2015464.1 hypothetical protein [Hydrogenophaga sp.]